MELRAAINLLPEGFNVAQPTMPKETSHCLGTTIAADNTTGSFNDTHDFTNTTIGYGCTSRTTTTSSINNNNNWSQENDNGSDGSPGRTK